MDVMSGTNCDMPEAHTTYLILHATALASFMTFLSKLNARIQRKANVNTYFI